MRPFALIALLAATMLALASRPHEYHVSIAEVHHRAGSHTLEASVKVFTDDVEGTLEMLGAPRLQIGSPKEHPSTDSLLAAYLGHRLRLSLGGCMLSQRFLGKEVEYDATWCYLEIPLPQGAGGTLHIENRILLERFADQSNLVHFNSGGTQRTLMMDNRQPSGQLSL